MTQIEYQIVAWKQPETWHHLITSWVQPHLKDGAVDVLSKMRRKNIPWDDPDWLWRVLAPRIRTDEDHVKAVIADELTSITMKVYHGCRVNDAGVYFREGLKINDPEQLKNEARKIVSEEAALAWMRPSIEQRIADFNAVDRDNGRLYVCLDDRPQLDHIGHYALYGSEWMLCFLGSGGHQTLRSRGVPTILEIDLPLALTSDFTRRDLAATFLQEWTRRMVNKTTEVPEVDFTILLRENLPPESISSHYHPASLSCPFNNHRRFISTETACPSCA